MKTLVAALVAARRCVAVAAGCGEKKETTAAPGSRSRSTLDARLLPQRRPRRHLRGAGRRRRSGAPGSTCDLQPPPDPSAPLKLLAAGQADLAISYEPELLLARDQGLQARRGRRDRPEAADLDDRARRQGTSRSVAQLTGKRVGHRRDPLPVRLPEDDPAPRRRGPRRGQARSNVGFNLVPAMLSKKVDATLGGFWNYEGIQLARSASTRRSSAWTRPACRPTTSWSFVARARTARTARATQIRRFLRAARRRLRRRAARPGSGRDGAGRGQPRPRPQASSGVGQGDAAGVLPGRRGKPFGFQDPRLWARYGDWMLRQPAAHAAAERRPRADERVPAGAGAVTRRRQRPARPASRCAPRALPRARRARRTRAPRLLGARAAGCPCAGARRA